MYIRKNRITAMQLLFTVEMNKVSLDNAIDMWDENPLDEEAIELAKAVYDDLANIDNVISCALTNYSLYRLNLVDKQIVRIATYEMMHDTPYAIAINEALEITKEFSDQGDKKATAFNNKLLDNIKKIIKK